MPSDILIFNSKYGDIRCDWMSIPPLYDPSTPRKCSLSFSLFLKCHATIIGCRTIVQPYKCLWKQSQRWPFCFYNNIGPYMLSLLYQPCCQRWMLCYIGFQQPTVLSWDMQCVLYYRLTGWGWGWGWGRSIEDLVLLVSWVSIVVGKIANQMVFL